MHRYHVAIKVLNAETASPEASKELLQVSQCLTRDAKQIPSSASYTRSAKTLIFKHVVLQ